MKLSSRQILFFLAAAAPIGKIVLMPARLARACANDLLFPVLAQLLVQAAIIFCVLLLARREQTLYALIRDAAGGVAAKIAAILFSAFLLFAAFLPVVEQKLLVRSIFYDTIPAYLVFTPFFIFSAYLCARPLCTVGRMWDILTPLAAVALAGIALLSVGSADYGALAPAGAAGWEGVARGTQAACSSTFYGVFSEIAVAQTHAFARMSGFFSGMTVLGRIDYLFIFAAAFVMTFYVILPMQAAVGTLSEAFGKSRALPALLSAGINLAMLAAVYLTNFHTSQVIEMLTGTLFWLYPVFAAGVPLLLVLIFGRRTHEAVS